jgi:hypothetical protein
MFHELGQAMLVPPVHRFQPRTSPPRAAEATEKTFREAMRHLAGGVCIVTVGAGGDRAGVTATSVSSLCAEPPTLLVCVNRASPCYAALTRFGAFAVNVLSADQREFAERFASGSSLKQSERFRGALARLAQRSALPRRFDRRVRLRRRGANRTPHPRHRHWPRAVRVGRRRIGRARPLARQLRSSRLGRRRGRPRHRPFSAAWAELDLPLTRSTANSAQSPSFGVDQHGSSQ